MRIVPHENERSCQGGPRNHTPLKDALEFLSDRYDVKVVIDTKAFETIGVPKALERPVTLPRLAGVRLDAVLRMILEQVRGDIFSGAYILRKDFVEITTSYHANTVGLRMVRDKQTIKEKLDTPVVILGIPEAPLNDVLRDLVQATGLPFKSTMAAKWNTRVKLPRLEDVPFATVLHLLASQAGMTVQVMVDAVTVTAAKLRRPAWPPSRPAGPGASRTYKPSYRGPCPRWTAPTPWIPSPPSSAARPCGSTSSSTTPASSSERLSACGSGPSS